MSHFTKILSLVRAPWGCDITYLQGLATIVDRRLFRGEKLGTDELETLIGNEKAIVEARREAAGSASGSAAVVPVYGVIVPRGDFLNSSGSTSVEGLTKVLRALDANPQVSEIILDIDSPGGSVLGVDELAEIMANEIKTPITAVANHLMASAAYWIASAADKIVATPSAIVGSIGVYSMHTDMSGAAEKAGIKTTIVHAGARKVEGNPFEGLSDEVLANIQTDINETYDVFTARVAAGRGVSQSTVKSASFGEGSTLSSREALSVGMIDEIGTLDQVIQGITNSQSAAMARADLEMRENRMKRN
jgi:signal peptide peptidase SppA